VLFVGNWNTGLIFLVVWDMTLSADVAFDSVLKLNRKLYTAVDLKFLVSVTPLLTTCPLVSGDGYKC